MNDTLSRFSRQHLEAVEKHFENAPPPGPAAQGYRRILSHYYNHLIPPSASVLEIGCGDGALLVHITAARKTGVDLSQTQLARAKARLPEARFHRQSGETLELGETFDIIILSETLNFCADAQRLLDRLALHSTPATRLIINFHSNLWRPIHSFANWIGLRTRPPILSWLSSGDIENLLALSQWETIKRQPRMLWPVETPLVSTFLNRWIAPVVPFLGFTLFQIARPRPDPSGKAPSVSIIIPARNEAGNIEAAVQRTPDMGAFTELIFVEGHSQDNTWQEIERVRLAYPGRRIQTLRQTGKGKGNAVREGFAAAHGDILMILDADLTMPPEDLPKFYEAVSSGKAEFANGSRLVYPMDKKAMQFLNMIANKFFGIAFSWILGQYVKDTLCGTKVMFRRDYEKIAANRDYFGDFDPFGDFDLLFGANHLNLKIRDIPIRYRDRTYGTTNIQRWRHGLLLFKMLAFASQRIKFI